jgi:Flp pilus assembly CpaF family ATPase
MDDRIADQLRSDIESRRNILLRGVIETGETTLQQAFGNFIPSRERAFLIKDASEIHIGHNMPCGCLLLVQRGTSIAFL